ncbi:nuclear transport factor 2 family protein [Pseudomonas oryzihabitans]|uniref:nuclear transport factor 2 family protein n=1 Tax=Pseudomonas oryzihabitans TaxID=47885 RepID=UPI0021B1F972|nr:nuclear transport factor 2 family protein [Pseudomonas psychrotolerans]
MAQAIGTNPFIAAIALGRLQESTVMNLAQHLTLSGLLACALLSGGLSNAHADSTPERNRTLIEQAFNDWQAGRGSFFDAVLSPDVVWTIQGSGPAAGVYRGREDFLQRAVRPFAQRLAAPIVPNVHAIWAQGDTVVVRWDGKGTAVDGAPYSNDYVWIFELRDGRATRVEAFLDLAAYQAVIDRISLADNR